MRSGPFSALLFVLVLTLAEGQDQLEGEKVARFKKVNRVGLQTSTISLHQFHLQLIIAGWQTHLDSSLRSIASIEYNP